MLFLISTAVALGVIIGLKFDRQVLVVVVGTGLAAGLGMMVRSGHPPAGGINGLAIFAASVVAGFLISRLVLTARRGPLAARGILPARRR